MDLPGAQRGQLTLLLWPVTGGKESYRDPAQFGDSFEIGKDFLAGQRRRLNIEQDQVRRFPARTIDDRRWIEQCDDLSIRVALELQAQDCSRDRGRSSLPPVC